MVSGGRKVNLLSLLDIRIEIWGRFLSQSSLKGDVISFTLTLYFINKGIRYCKIRKLRKTFEIIEKIFFYLYEIIEEH